MKFKYFLRGVGAGIIFGALIMLVAYLTTGANELSDKEIIERAENLGMVMEEDMVITAKDKDTEEADDIGTSEMTTASTTETTTEVSSQEILDTPDVSLEGVVDGSIENSTTEANSQEATTEQTVDTELVTAKVSVTSGMTSSEIAKLLEDAGIIEDYLDFDEYLNENGYSTQLRINDYEFNSGMSYEELAKELIKEDKQ